MRHLILGNGPAGVVAAETLRKLAPGDSVTVLGDEPGEPGTWLRKDPGHFGRLGIELKAGRAAAVDSERRLVKLESGEALPYDRLLVATGSRPNRPPIPGIESSITTTSGRSCWAAATPASPVQTPRTTPCQSVR